MSDCNLQFEQLLAEFVLYRDSRKQFVEYMRDFGIETRNVDPFADMAEIVVAREFNGRLRPRANKDFDVITPDGARIQVRSLRVSSDRPEDNPRNWKDCTRRMKNGVCGPLIDADILAIVVFLDFNLHSLLTFPITLTEKFPILNVQDLYLRHVNRLLEMLPLELEPGVTAKMLTYS